MCSLQYCEVCEAKSLWRAYYWSLWSQVMARGQRQVAVDDTTPVSKWQMYCSSIVIHYLSSALVSQNISQSLTPHRGSHTCILQAIKNWMVRRPGNMAIDFAHALGTYCHIYMISWSECFEICFIAPHIVVILLQLPPPREMVTLALRYGADSSEFIYCHCTT